jgi:N4-gp56 family major capsid protein
MAWVWDSPTGTYRNHALSEKIREAAAAEALFSQFVSPEPGYGKMKGEAVTITRFHQLPLASRVSETERLPEGRPAISTKSVTVSEWGYKSPMTELEELLTHFDLRSKIQRMLKTQMKLTMDKMVADALKTTLIKVVNVGGVITITTNGTPAAQTTTNLTIAALRTMRDYLAGTLKSPPFRNGNYVGVLSTKAARGIKNDSEYKDWLSPTTSDPFTSGRMRDVEGITLFETNHYNALANAIGAAGVAGEALFFGEDAGFLATVLDPELRIGLSEDLGRFREIGWYGVLEAGLTWDTASEARVMHYTST